MSRLKNLYNSLRDNLVGQVEDPERERHLARLGQAVGGLCVAGAVVANIIGEYGPQAMVVGGIGAARVVLETVMIDGIDTQVIDGQQRQIDI